MTDQPSPRLRFQFRLRTLMIGVTLLCVVGGYLAIQARIVKHRNELMSRLRAGGGVRFLLATDIEDALRDMKAQTKPNALPNAPRIPWVRECLGDYAVWWIWYRPERIPDNLLNEIKAYFPEAVIHPIGPFQPSAALGALKRGAWPPPQN